MSRRPAFTRAPIGLLVVFASLTATAAPAQSTKSGNPILPGWYADPEAHVFDGQYWIFPTYSAPYDQQTFLDAFSSRDLVTWTKHSHVLDVADVSWAKRAVWAPSIVEKDGWYYLFFGANDIQNDKQVGGIGVARARTPDGPFKDSSRQAAHRQVSQRRAADRSDGVQGSRRHVLHRLRRLAALQHREAERRLHRRSSRSPTGRRSRRSRPTGYVEGAFMLIKDGKYYFMWSEGGWTGPNYAVAYAVGSSPFGPFERVGKILQQDSDGRDRGRASLGATVAGPGKWYIVYHRRPLGETDRNHRVVSIDELRFDDRGMIQPVRITKEGVAADPIGGKR